MNFTMPKTTVILSVIVLLLTAAASGACYQAYHWRLDLLQTKTALENANKQVLALTKDVGSCTTQLGELTNAARQPDPVKRELADQVEAFAIQVKTCELLLKKLDSKGRK